MWNWKYRTPNFTILKLFSRFFLEMSALSTRCRSTWIWQFPLAWIVVIPAKKHGSIIIITLFFQPEKKLCCFYFISLRNCSLLFLYPLDLCYQCFSISLDCLLFVNSIYFATIFLVENGEINSQKTLWQLRNS